MWVDLEYDLPIEMGFHTLNFLQYFRTVWDHRVVKIIEEDVVGGAKYDINSLMSSSSENGMDMAYWCDVFQLTPGDLIELRRRAPQWQKTYSGLNDEQKEHVKLCLKRHQQQYPRSLSQRSRNGVEPNG